MNDCVFGFNDVTCDVLQENLKLNLREKLNLIFKTKKGARVYNTLESPGYEIIKSRISGTQFQEISLNWLANNSKTTLTEPKSPDYHTFYVLTGDEKNKAMDTYLKKSSVLKISQLVDRTYLRTEDAALNALRKTATLAEILDKKFHEIIDGKPVTVWKANSIEELKDTLRKIMNLKD